MLLHTNIHSLHDIRAGSDCVTFLCASLLLSCRRLHHLSELVCS